MNTTTQQFPSNPALDFAQSILEETNGALELIEILHEISEGIDEDANTNDRITATNALADRAFGKSPKQITLSAGPNPEPAPNTDDTDVEPAPYSIRGALREAPPAVHHNEPESPRRVTQINDSLHQSLGPAPSASHHSQQHVDPAPYSIRGAGFKPARPTGQSPEHETPDPFDPYSIQSSIQDYILTITNNGQTLRNTLLEIARAKDDPKVIPSHRRRAAILLLDRALGTNPNAISSGLCPDCRQRWSAHPDSSDHPQQSIVEEEPFDEQVWDEIIAELKQLEEDGVITPDPNAPKYDFSNYLSATDEQVAPYADEVAAKFSADIALRVERQKQWPEIEERRRKKLAQIYPSHSDDDELPDT